ncbi:MAG: SPOR domain-containing protein [Calditrichaeota bacterium]|nr:SPOR domain-containing protein [Calditrichota bacterium]RQW03242.1 MAG: SPOR domain-containing protein [Calditrichota bacterium]
MKQFFRFISVFLLILLFIGSCATTQKKERAETAAGEAEKLDESFDPVVLDDDDITFEEAELRVEIESGETEYLPGTEDFDAQLVAPENKLVDGFRIQLLSTKDLESATRAKVIAEEQFSDIRAKFYLDFDSPNYKVRLGDFKSREAAEDIREVVRSRGYPKSWIVKTKVWSNPEFPLKKDSPIIDSPEMD